MSHARPTILVVDDVPANIHVMFEALGADHELLFATSGQEALAIADEQHPDLILLDVIMPALDGYETCRRLKADAQTRDIPVIFVTSRGEEVDEVNGFACGAADYLIKPLSVPIAKARIRSHIELKHARDLLDKQARLDGLTGLLNRRSFDESLDREWRRALRGKTSLGVMMIDVDVFKSYNDLYGHLAGDQCLRAVARTLQQGMRRPGDIAARYGGEEFGCVVSDAELKTTCALAERLRSSVESLNIKHAASPYGIVTISLGVAACVPAAINDWAALLADADQRLYEAKDAGRNLVLPAQA